MRNQEYLIKPESFIDEHHTPRITPIRACDNN